MSGLLIEGRCICKLDLIVIIALMLLKIFFVILELLAQLALALSELALADLELLALCALRIGAGDRSIFIVIKLADVGERTLLLILISILIHILLEDLRKLLYFSALEYVIGKSFGCSGNLIESDFLKLLSKAVILVNVALKGCLTVVGILTKRLGSSEALGVKLENASLIFSALCKSIKLFFLGSGNSVCLFSISELSVKVSYYLVVVVDLLGKSTLAKTCESRERAKSANACSLANGHSKDLAILGAVVILDICVVIALCAAYHYAGSLFALGDVVDDKLGLRNFFNCSAKELGVDNLRSRGILGDKGAHRRNNLLTLSSLDRLFILCAF